MPIDPAVVEKVTAAVATNGLLVADLASQLDMSREDLLMNIRGEIAGQRLFVTKDDKVRKWTAKDTQSNWP
jgi:hypothetical protein